MEKTYTREEVIGMILMGIILSDPNHTRYFFDMVRKQAQTKSSEISLDMKSYIIRLCSNIINNDIGRNIVENNLTQFDIERDLILSEIQDHIGGFINAIID